MSISDAGYTLGRTIVLYLNLFVSVWCICFSVKEFSDHWTNLFFFIYMFFDIGLPKRWYASIWDICFKCWLFMKIFVRISSCNSHDFFLSALISILWFLCVYATLSMFCCRSVFDVVTSCQHRVYGPPCMCVFWTVLWVQQYLFFWSWAMRHLHGRVHILHAVIYADVASVGYE